MQISTNDSFYHPFFLLPFYHHVQAVGYLDSRRLQHQEGVYLEELLLPLSRLLVVVASLALLLPALEAAVFSNPLEERSVQRLALDLPVGFIIGWLKLLCL